MKWKIILLVAAKSSTGAEDVKGKGAFLMSWASIEGLKSDEMWHKSHISSLLWPSIDAQFIRKD